MIALITGYYKVYVDNTSNTPLPVENEETWPFSFRKSSPRKDGRSRTTPDLFYEIKKITKKIMLTSRQSNG